MTAHDSMLSELHQHCEPTLDDDLHGVTRPEYKDVFLCARDEAVASVAHRAGLTTREVHVLRLCVDGLDSEDVIDRLEISRKTYNAHVSNILRKTGEFRIYRLVIQILLEAAKAACRSLGESVGARVRSLP